MSEVEGKCFFIPFSKCEKQVIFISHRKFIATAFFKILFQVDCCLYWKKNGVLIQKVQIFKEFVDTRTVFFSFQVNCQAMSGSQHIHKS